MRLTKCNNNYKIIFVCVYLLKLHNNINNIKNKLSTFYNCWLKVIIVYKILHKSYIKRKTIKLLIPLQAMTYVIFYFILFYCLMYVCLVTINKLLLLLL
jgi:hypothetical protein